MHAPTSNTLKLETRTPQTPNTSNVKHAIYQTSNTSNFKHVHSDDRRLQPPTLKLATMNGRTAKPTVCNAPPCKWQTLAPTPTTLNDTITAHHMHNATSCAWKPQSTKTTHANCNTACPTAPHHRSVHTMKYMHDHVV